MQGISEEQKKSQEVRGGMIDIEHAKQEFENYLDEYDRQDEQIYLKIEHTYGVVKYAGEIARRMECSREDVELAELIGLLHDIGRFEQIRRFHSFEPGTMDHAVFGAELLFGEEKMIRRFVREDLFDDLINAMAVDDLLSLGARLVFYYVAGLLAYLVVTWKIYSRRYDEAVGKLKIYQAKLRRLDKKYNQQGVKENGEEKSK